MKPSKLALQDFTAGDTWEGIPSITIRVNGAAPASDIASVTMRFKQANLVPGDVVELSSAAGKITIVNANTWEISVPEQLVPGLTHGKWMWRIRITDAAGKKATYLADELCVLEDV